VSIYVLDSSIEVKDLKKAAMRILGPGIWD